MNIGEVMEVAESLSKPSAVEDEIEAMQRIAEGFRSLDVQARTRTLDWARARYAVDATAVSFAELFVRVIELVVAHMKNTSSPTEADKNLWRAILSGTKYERKMESKLADCEKTQ